MNQGPSCSMIAVNSFVIVGVGMNAAYSRGEKNSRSVCLANGLPITRYERSEGTASAAASSSARGAAAIGCIRSGSTENLSSSEKLF